MRTREQGWVGRLGPWIGIGTSPAALMAGGGLSAGHDAGTVIGVTLVGVALLTLIAVAQGMLGVHTRSPLGVVMARALPGRIAGRVATVLMLVMMIGWFGVNVDVGGTALARLLVVPATLGWVVLGGVAVAATLRGLGTLSWTALLTGTATVLLAGWGLALAAERAPLGLGSTGGGASEVGILTGVSLVVGYGAAFALRTPDFTFDLARRRQVVWCGVLGLGVPLLVFATAGAALQASTGHWNIADVLSDLGTPAAGQAFVALGFLGSVLTNLHSGRLAFAAATGWGATVGLWVVTATGLALAASGFGARMIDYMVVLAIVVPGLIVVCVASAVGLNGRHGGTIWGLSTLAGAAMEYAGGGGGVLAATAVGVVGVAVTAARGRGARRPCT
ncbi:hypothetical protein [Mycobacterium sp.]|uniref:hypothetical protein n=1 Tax=Mycobacterium sp. TaxID=1785 RepID=UPI003A8566B0